MRKMKKKVTKNWFNLITIKYPMCLDSDQDDDDEDEDDGNSVPVMTNAFALLNDDD